MNEPRRFRKKPVVVDVMGPITVDNVEDIAEWCGGRMSAVVLRNPVGAIVLIDIDTLEGSMTATKGDYVIRGVAGEFYPCKPHIFEQTYEEATDE